MTTSALCALLKLNSKEDLVKTESQCAVVNLCKEFGLQQQQYLMVADSIQQITESGSTI
jgi:hypothetical protein